jgi:hypothetical protein
LQHASCLCSCNICVNATLYHCVCCIIRIALPGLCACCTMTYLLIVRRILVHKPIAITYDP